MPILLKELPPCRIYFIRWVVWGVFDRQANRGHSVPIDKGDAKPLKLRRLKCACGLDLEDLDRSFVKQRILALINRQPFALIFGFGIEYALHKQATLGDLLFVKNVSREPGWANHL